MSYHLSSDEQGNRVWERLTLMLPTISLLTGAKAMLFKRSIERVRDERAGKGKEEKLTKDLNKFTRSADKDLCWDGAILSHRLLDLLKTDRHALEKVFAHSG